MTGLFRFLGDILKPLLTLLVTVIGAGFVMSVLSIRADTAIEDRLPAWERLDPAKNAVRDWLGLAEEDEAVWWQFWRD